MQVTPLSSKATALVLMSLVIRSDDDELYLRGQYIEVGVYTMIVPLRTESRRLNSRRSASSAGAQIHTIY
jgi:hypothetical protein